MRTWVAALCHPQLSGEGTHTGGKAQGAQALIQVLHAKDGHSKISQCVRLLVVARRGLLKRGVMK